MSKTTKVVFGIMLALAVLAPVASLAALPNPSPEQSGQPVSLSEVEDIIRLVARFAIVVSMVIAVIFIVWGGIRYMAAGGDDGKVKIAKATIINGIIGAAVVLAVGVILNTIAGIFTRSALQ